MYVSAVKCAAILCAALYASHRPCAAEGVPAPIVECLANEAAFSGYECEFILRDGTSTSREDVERGEIAQLGCEIHGIWGRESGREWVRGTAVKSVPMGSDQYTTGIDRWDGARARDSRWRLKITPLAATLESLSKIDDKHLMKVSPWCSLGFLSPSRKLNFAGRYFAFVSEHGRFGNDFIVTREDSQISYETDASEGNLTQRQKLTIDQSRGHLPVLYVANSRRGRDPKPAHESTFVSSVLDAESLPNGCVFPTKVIAYYYPDDQFAFFRVRSFEATNISPIPENADPLLIEAQEQIQLHNNQDVYVSAINRGEKVYLSDLPRLAGRLERAVAHGKSPQQEPQSYLALQVAIVLAAVVIVALLGKRFVFSRS